MKKQKPDAEPANQSVNLDNITINNGAPVNADTRVAIEALAHASSMHAEALIEMAKALQGSPSTMGNAVHIGK